MDIIRNKFEEYCYAENYDKVKEYLETFKDLPNYNNGEYFEIVANVEMMKLFIVNGAHLTIDHHYVLYTCAYHKHYDCLDYLLSLGANLENIRGTCGYSNAVDYVEKMFAKKQRKNFVGL